MAKQQFTSACAEIVPTTTVELEFEGAWLVDSGDGKCTIRFDAVTHIPEPEYVEVEKVLMQAGVAKEDAMTLTEQFASRVHTYHLGRMLAERATRVG